MIFSGESIILNYFVTSLLKMSSSKEYLWCIIILLQFVSEMVQIMAYHCSVPSHYLNQWWPIVNQTLRHKLQWNFCQNLQTFSDENVFENVVCKMADILFRLHNVNSFEAEWGIYASVNNTIIGSDNGLSPGWRQAIIWTNAGILFIRPLGTNFSEIVIEIETFSLTN